METRYLKYMRDESVSLFISRQLGYRRLDIFQFSRKKREKFVLKILNCSLAWKLKDKSHSSNMATKALIGSAIKGNSISNEMLESDVNIPALPPVNASCWSTPAAPPDDTIEKQQQLPPEEKIVETTDDDVQTAVVNKNIYTQFNKIVNVIVNRNHYHTLKVIQNENYFNNYVTQKVFKVNDIHHQNIEFVEGEKKEINDAKELVTVEPARCILANEPVRKLDYNRRSHFESHSSSGGRYTQISPTSSFSSARQPNNKF